MDPFDESILRTLKDREPMDFQQIKDEAGFSHNTVRLNLNNLVERSMITREKTPAEGARASV